MRAELVRDREGESSEAVKGEVRLRLIEGVGGEPGGLKRDSGRERK